MSFRGGKCREAEFVWFLSLFLSFRWIGSRMVILIIILYISMEQTDTVGEFLIFEYTISPAELID
jgi:hypothetical protein